MNLDTQDISHIFTIFASVFTMITLIFGIYTYLKGRKIRRSEIFTKFFQMNSIENKIELCNLCRVIYENVDGKDFVFHSEYIDEYVVIKNYVITMPISGYVPEKKLSKSNITKIGKENINNHLDNLNLEYKVLSKEVNDSLHFLTKKEYRTFKRIQEKYFFKGKIFSYENIVDAVTTKGGPINSTESLKRDADGFYEMVEAGVYIRGLDIKCELIGQKMDLMDYLVFDDDFDSDVTKVSRKFIINVNKIGGHYFYPLTYQDKIKKAFSKYKEGKNQISGVRSYIKILLDKETMKETFGESGYHQSQLIGVINSFNRKTDFKSIKLKVSNKINNQIINFILFLKYFFYVPSFYNEGFKKGICKLVKKVLIFVVVVFLLLLCIVMYILK